MQCFVGATALFVSGTAHREGPRRAPLELDAVERACGARAQCSGTAGTQRERRETPNTDREKAKTIHRRIPDGGQKKARSCHTSIRKATEDWDGGAEWAPWTVWTVWTGLTSCGEGCTSYYTAMVCGIGVQFRSGGEHAPAPKPLPRMGYLMGCERMLPSRVSGTT